MNRTSVMGELLKIALAASTMPGQVLTPDPSLRLREDVGLESLGFIDLIVALEDRYQIVLDPIADDFDVGLRTLGSLADLVITIAGRGQPR